MKMYIKSESYWSTDVNTVDEVMHEIEKAAEAGTFIADVLDYLDELESVGRITAYEAKDLTTWAYQLFDRRY